jgi:uncharacterized protein YkwD
MQSVPERRSSPLVLVVVLVVAVLAPVAAAVATGLVSGPATSEVATADGERSAVRSTPDDADEAPAGTSSTSASTTTASTTTTTAPPPETTTTTTTPPTTAPPTTEPAPPPPPPDPPPSTVSERDRVEAAVVDLANAARAANGCGPVEIDDRLVAAARAHSEDMAANGYFSHDSLDGSSFSDRVLAAGYPRPAAENIAQGQDSAQSVHDAWMNSSGHRANILNCDLTAVGVGVHLGTWTWTQDFGA